MLFKELDRIKRNTIMMTIKLAFVGNLLLITPQGTVPFVGNIVSFLLLVAAVIGIMNYLVSRKALINYIKLAGSLFAALFGIMLFVIDDMFMTLLTWLTGTLPIIFGFYGIYHALAFARRSGRRGWWILIILSLLLLAFGTMPFVNPWNNSPEASLQVAGGVLMYSSIVGLISLIWIWPGKSASTAKQTEEDA